MEPGKERRGDVAGDGKSLHQCDGRKDRMFRFRLRIKREILDQSHITIKKVGICQSRYCWG